MAGKGALMSWTWIAGFVGVACKYDEVYAFLDGEVERRAQRATKVFNTRMLSRRRVNSPVVFYAEVQVGKM